MEKVSEMIKEIKWEESHNTAGEYRQTRPRTDRRCGWKEAIEQDRQKIQAM